MLIEFLKSLIQVDSENEDGEIERNLGDLVQRLANLKDSYALTKMIDKLDDNIMKINKTRTISVLIAVAHHLLDKMEIKENNTSSPTPLYTINTLEKRNPSRRTSFCDIPEVLVTRTFNKFSGEPDVFWDIGMACKKFLHHTTIVLQRDNVQAVLRGNDESYKKNIDLIKGSQTVSHSVSNLGLLAMDAKNITAEDLILVARRCRSIKILDFPGCDISDAAIDVVTRYCRGLTKITIGKCQYVTKSCLDAISKNCTQLEILVVPACTTLWFKNGQFRNIKGILGLQSDAYSINHIDERCHTYPNVGNLYKDYHLITKTCHIIDGDRCVSYKSTLLYELINDYTLVYYSNPV